MARFRVSGKALAVVLTVFLAVAAVWIRSVKLSSHEKGMYAWRPERSPFPSKVFGFLNRESAGRAGIGGESRIAQDEASTKIARQALDAGGYGTTPNYPGGDYRAHRVRSQAIPIGIVSSQPDGGGYVQNQAALQLGRTGRGSASGSMGSLSDRTLDRGRLVISNSPDGEPAVPVSDASQSSQAAGENPFLNAIHDTFGDEPPPVAASAPETQLPPPEPPAPPTEEIASVMSPPPQSAVGQETTGSISNTRPEDNRSDQDSSVVAIGDFGNHRMQIVRAAKSSSTSYVLEGNLGAVGFEAALDFAPFQSFWLGSGRGLPSLSDMVVADHNFSLIDWYARSNSGEFTFQTGFYFSSGALAAAVAPDIDGDGTPDLLVGARPRGAEFAGQGSVVHIYQQRNGEFVVKGGIQVPFPVGAMHASRSGGQTRLTVTDSTLVAAQIVLLDGSGSVIYQSPIMPATQRQDAKLTLSDGRTSWIRLGEFEGVTFIGSFEEGEFHLIGTVGHGGPFPLLLIGDVNLNGQRRVWLRF